MHNIECLIHNLLNFRCVKSVQNIRKENNVKTNVLRIFMRTRIFVNVFHVLTSAGGAAALEQITASHVAITEFIRYLNYSTKDLNMHKDKTKRTKPCTYCITW